MAYSNPAVVLYACIMLTSVTLADDATPSDTNSATAKSRPDAHDRSTFGSKPAPQPYLDRPSPYPAPLMRPNMDLEFQDSSALGHFSKFRTLSFVTLAESGPTKLFLGVNDDGLVGLHFAFFSKRGADRTLELARMPYLKRKNPEREAEPDRKFPIGPEPVGIRSALGGK
jgi:hypothetical protein